MLLPRSERLLRSSIARLRANERAWHHGRSAVLACFLLLAVASPGFAQQPQPEPLELEPGWFCGTLRNHFGPFDYRTAPPEQKNLVERFHFTPSVETLRKGNTGYLGGDIGYTLHVFPNHPRALLAMARLGRKERTTKPRSAGYTVECYFERALRFAPDDALVKVLYASWLVGEKRVDDARAQLKQAEKLKPDEASILYNLGLVYADVGDYDKALGYAHRAYGAGIGLPGLRERLKRVGRWKEAPAG